MEDVIEGRAAYSGRAEGELLLSREPLSFWGGYDYRTGEIIDRRHPLSGYNVGGKVLALPFTRGSSSTTAVLLEAVRSGTAPAAILTTGTDPFLSLASIVAYEMYTKVVPVIALTAEDFEKLRNGDYLRITPAGRIEVERT
jgi:predicted aconitase with swiveling domain